MCAELCLFAASLCLIFGGSAAAAIVMRARREAGRLLAAARADREAAAVERAANELRAKRLTAALGLLRRG